LFFQHLNKAKLWVVYGKAVLVQAWGHEDIMSPADVEAYQETKAGTALAK